jgi:hypothetical protein
LSCIHKITHFAEILFSNSCISCSYCSSSHVLQPHKYIVQRWEIKHLQVACPVISSLLDCLSGCCSNCQLFYIRSGARIMRINTHTHTHTSGACAPWNSSSCVLHGARDSSGVFVLLGFGLNKPYNLYWIVCESVLVHLSLTNQPTNYMEQSPSWEADNNHSASQEIPCLSWNPKVHYRVQRIRHWSISWVRRFQSTASHPICFKIHPNVILISKHRPSKSSLSFTFSDESVR